MEKKELQAILDNNKPLNEELFKKFLNDELTVKEVKSMEEELSNRFVYIVYTVAKQTERQVDWFDYDNEGGEYNPGYFDTTVYKTKVGITGQFYDLIKDRYDNYDNYFPVEWFYKNFEEDLNNEITAYNKEQQQSKEKKNLKKQNSKEKLENIKDSIVSKLSTEELAYIKFISLEEAINLKENSVTQNLTKNINIKVKKLEDLGVNAKEKFNEYKQKEKKPLEFKNWLDLMLEKLEKPTKKIKIK